MPVDLGKVKLLSSEQIAQAEKPREPLLESPALAITSPEKERRKEICDFISRAYHHRLMTSTHGSYSARVGHDHFVITPFHFDRKHLGLGDLVSIHAGHQAPGSQPSRAVQLHRAIYREHPGINAVLNALPVSATAFAVSDFKLDTRTIPESYLFLKDVTKIPYAEIYGDGTPLAKHLTPRSPVALLENNGVMIAGRSVLDAFDRLEVLEATAQAILRSRALAPLRPMSNEVIEELVDAFPGM
ncbi:MAG: class II aldolase/adducin family protein [Chthoniobacteraceae bacterium]